MPGSGDVKGADNKKRTELVDRRADAAFLAVFLDVFILAGRQSVVEIGVDMFQNMGAGQIHVKERLLLDRVIWF